MDVSADGNIPVAYAPWSGRTADQATVMSNMEKLARWLKHHGHADQANLIVGDRAMLNAEIAIAYDKHGLRHLTGLKAATPELKKGVGVWSDAQMEACPIEEGPSPQYWGRGTSVTFEHEGESVTHRALVVTSGPLRDQLRQSRQGMIDALLAELESLRSRIGQPRLTTVKSVQRSANARLRESKVAQFVQSTAYETTTGQVNLVWQVKEELLAQTERMDGRYLLVTNDWNLAHHEMFRLYRAKDGVEPCFHICKDDLTISPLYLHQDQRIASMIFVGIEIRQNPYAVRGAPLQAVSQQSLDLVMAGLDNPDLRSAFAAARNDRLSPEQRNLLSWFISAKLRADENRFRQVELGILDASTFQQLSNHAAYRMPHFAEYWALRGDLFAADFQELVLREFLPLSQSVSGEDQ